MPHLGHLEHPLLVLVDEGTHVWGISLLSQHGGDADAIARELGAEYFEVAERLEKLGVTSNLGATVLGAHFLSTVDAPNLETLLACTPDSPAGQKSLLVYKDDGWLMGLWNNPKRMPDWPGLSLSSVADFFGGPVSRAARARRGGLEHVRGRQVLDGDYDVLRRAMALPDIRQPFGQWEQHSGVRYLAQWWNERAPEGQRHAAFARLYAWNEGTGSFDALDPEEPATLPEQMGKAHSMALFEREGEPTLVAIFMRGREHNTEDRYGTTVYHADGHKFWVVGCDGADVDDASYCAVALRSAKKLLG